MKKSAGIIIRDKQLLVLRSRGKNIFFAPGGKPEEGENPEEALIRELREEINIHVAAHDLRFFGNYQAPAAGYEDVILNMDVYFVDGYRGKISPANEIEETRWIDSQNIANVKVSSIFKEQVLPALVDLALVK